MKTKKYRFGQVLLILGNTILFIKLGAAGLFNSFNFSLKTKETIVGMAVIFNIMSLVLFISDRSDRRKIAEKDF